jgi:hypothetical protein
MKNREIFLRDPATAKLINNGQARINDGMTAQEWATLREELSNFVCEGQYADGFLRIIEAFLSRLGATDQSGAWVSGFYGSGKSHLLKMIGHLCKNTVFPDGATARSLVPRLPAEIGAALKELDTAARRAGGMHAAFGALPSGSAESTRLTILGIILRSCGLPDQYRLAKFCLYLKKNDFYDAVKKDVEDAGRDFMRELEDLTVSPVLRAALLKVDPHLGNADALRTLLAKEFTQPTDISTTEFLRMTREVLGGKDALPLTILVLDEVQIYVRNNLDRTKEVVEVAEALGKQMDSRVLLVGAGQSALSSDVPEFPWMRARFKISVELSDADVENVTRRVLLAKRPEKIEAVRQVLASHAGEIARQLSSTAIATRTEDQDILADDYPILPVRRRFWEHVLRAVDPSGTNAMLRSQLQNIHEALRELAESPLGTVVPADIIFDQLQAGMVQQGVLLRELSETIRKQDRLAGRLCGLIFLIRKLPRTSGADCGVRATPEMLADLLVSDLTNDGTKLRKEVPLVLQKLVDEGIILKDGEEYNLQTKESQEWDKEFRNRQTQIGSNESVVHQKRDALLQAALQKEINTVRLKQGASNEPRELVLHFAPEPPDATGQNVPVWVRNEWNASQKNVVDAARAAGTDSPILFVFVAKAEAEKLREQIIRAEAARGTIDGKGVPSTREGEEARSSMGTRLSDAERARDQLIAQIASGAKVYKGGGTELFNLTLAEKVRDGATDALARLFPRFGEADHKGWTSVINRARNGDDSPLRAVDFDGATEQHPVCREILSKMGSGIEGRELRKHFSASPYGWPQDAVDGGIIALHSGAHLLARYNSQALAVGQLDQNKISKTEFRTESIILTGPDKLKLRGLFQDAGISAKASDDLEVKSTEYLALAESLAGKAGGTAPLPEPPKTTKLTDLRARVGNDRLKGLLDQADVLKAEVAKWKKQADLAAKRVPEWEKLQKFLSVGVGVGALAEVEAAAKGILDGRLLLDNSDHVPPMIKQAAHALRTAVTGAHSGFASRHAELLKELEASDVWQRISGQQRISIMAEEGISSVPDLEVGSDEQLLSALQNTPVASWNDKTAALTARFQNAARKASQLLEPKTQYVTLRSDTLRTEAEVKAWLATQETTLVAKLKEGPVVVG